jgi:RNA polymerase sigma-70 factor (ECF subfamily)
MQQADIDKYLTQAGAGDRHAIGTLLEGHRQRLERLVMLRLDRRLRGRVDSGDVIQDVFLEAARRIPDYVRRPNMPFYLWLRFLTAQRLQALCRENLGAQKRDVRREQPTAGRAYPEASSEILAAQMIGKFTTPSQALFRAERKVYLRQALEAMDDTDREILALRHFEELGNDEVAHLLGLGKAAASKRYIRAIKRLKMTLDKVSGLSELPG